MEIRPKSINAIELSEWLKLESNKPIVIDVRENMELEIASFPFTKIHIPLSSCSSGDVKNKLNLHPNHQFVVLCHHGVRSLKFGYWLLDNKFLNEVWNLEEGIDGWSKYIDRKIPRY